MMTQKELKKHRDILFARFPPGQVPEAQDDLQKLGGVEVAALPENRSVSVCYDLQDHTLHALEDYLINKGYHLDNTLFSKLSRALVYYVEEIQLHNMTAPRSRLKQLPEEAFVKAWERHEHGDHDDTPPEWRDYR